ncbi:MAG: molybdopterin adenylyltransferase [Candidatus Latescibacteria bacterium]|nr:molybdopterin adenylyltransferase [Candidatus Latescibacterota bacterium]
MIKVGILTLSDKGSRGEREDKSGQILSEMVREIGGEVLSHQVLPDEKDVIVEWLVRMVDHQGLDLVLTTGGTGIAARDVTPEATREVIDRELPGFGEVMRMKSVAITPRGMLSRMIAGTRGQALIVNLPGSPKAVRECFGWVMGAIPHAIALLKGEGGECGREEPPR